jgi:di/tricarboxylate transporter
VPIRQMARAGIILNIVSIVLIPLITYTLGKLVFGF